MFPIPIYRQTTHRITDGKLDILYVAYLNYFHFFFYKDVPMFGFQNISYKINLYLWIGPVKALKANEIDSHIESAIQLIH